MLKAIQTKYRGYHFRSRLEARWAVFFDAANIAWEYEPEGFDLGGCYYLPDFFLPELDYYFEVKGSSEYDIEKLRKFARLIGKPLVVAEGNIPDPGEHNCGETIGLQFLSPTQPDDMEDGMSDGLAYGYKDMFLRCNGCGRIEVRNENYSTMKDSCDCQERGVRWMSLSDALKAARSARFEHQDKRGDNHSMAASVKSNLPTSSRQ